MRIQHLCKTPQDLANYIFELLAISKQSREDVYRPGDRLKCEPYFDWVRRRGGSDPVASTKISSESTESTDSGQYYMQIMDEYLREAFEKRDVLSNIGEQGILDLFGIDCPSYEVDADGSLVEYVMTLKDLEKQTLKWPYTFPLVIVGWIDYARDRMGASTVCFLDVVEERMFLDHAPLK
jgi:hypothetical protein